jgi:hypothetical protein
MAVSDETGGIPQKPRKPLVRLSEAQWIAARHQFESGELTVLQLCARYSVSERTVRHKIADEGWQKGLKLVTGAETKLQKVVDSHLEQVGEKIAGRIGKKLEADLAPWFEREKRRHVKDSLKRIRSRQRLIDGLVDETDVLTPKDAAYIAKSDDTYDNMARRNLGMNEGSGIGGSLSVQVLTNQAAVSISGPAA